MSNSKLYYRGITYTAIGMCWAILWTLTSFGHEYQLVVFLMFTVLMTVNLSCGLTLLMIHWYGPKAKQPESGITAG